LQESIRSAVDLPAKEILAHILDDLKKFCGNAPQYDDITLMVIQVK